MNDMDAESPRGTVSQEFPPATPGGDHLSPEQVAAFALGKLSVDEATVVEQHLLVCDRCAGFLGGVTIDPFVAALRRAAGDTTPTARDAEPRSTVASARNSLADANGSRPEAAGRYELRAEIARGGMGVVYRAFEPSIGREVAVKVLHDRHRTDPAATQRFVAEAQLTGRLQHPGVPPVFEVGAFPDGSPFLAMKLIEGRTLATVLEAPNRPDPAELLAVFEHICQAVAYAHSKAVIHRDLKPANVMVGAFGEVQVMDWGLAKQVGSEQLAVSSEDAHGLAASQRGAPTADLTHPGTVMGTPAYMAPEQARGEPADERADVFALGAVLCEILTARRPFEGLSSAEVINRVAAGNLAESLTHLAACGADAELVALANRCLSADRDSRPANAGAVAKAVAGLRAATEERARRAELARVKASAEARAKRKRRRVQFALAASLGLLCAAGLAAAWWQDRENDRRRSEVARQESDADHRADLNADALGAGLSACEIALRVGDTDRAAAALADAERRAPEPGGERHHERLVQCRIDLATLRELHAFDQFLWTPREVRQIDWREVVARARAVFVAFGVDPARVKPDVATRRVNASAVRERLFRVLDLWLAAEWVLDDRTGWVRELLRLSDPDNFRDAFRDALVSGDRTRAAVVVLAAKPEAEAQPARFSVILVACEVIPTARLRELLWAALLRAPGDLGILMALAESYPFDDPKTANERARWYQAALAVAPGNVAAHHGLVLALRLKGDSAGAEACIRDLCRRSPTSSNPRSTLGVILHEKKDFAGAAAAYREAIKLKPDDGELYHDLALTLHASGDLAGAIVAIREAIRLNPKDATARYRLGTALAAKGDLDEAITQYREAIRLNPSLVGPHMHLGGVMTLKGKVDESIECYREAVRLDPKDALAHMNLGVALITRGDIDEAIKECREALRYDPMHTLAHYNLGNALDRSGKRAEAIAEYQEAVKLDPKFVDARYNLARVYIGNGDVDRAAAEYREVLKQDPTLVRAHHDLGLILAQMDDLEGALAEFLETIRLDPTHAPAISNVGRIRYESGDHEAAIAAHREAIKHDPNYSMAHFNLGVALIERGDFTGALKSLQEAQRLKDRFAQGGIHQAKWQVEALRFIPEFAAGRDKIVDPVTLCEYAFICDRPLQRQYALATRLYARAFTADPKTAPGRRYHAARAAVQAASGLDIELTTFGVEEYGVLTDQARLWLQTELADLRSQAANPKNWPSIRRTCTRWKADPALAPVRAPEWLAEMSGTDRQAWQELWADVDALIVSASPVVAPPPRLKTNP